jgi:hypothetical protein
LFGRSAWYFESYFVAGSNVRLVGDGGDGGGGMTHES